MTIIDIRTMLVVLFAGNLAAAIFFTAYRFGVPDRTDVFDTTFLMGKLFQSAGWLLIWAREEVPHSLSLVGGNVLLTLGVAAECYALISLARVARREWGIAFTVLAAVGVGSCLSMHYLTDISAAFAVYMAVLSLFLAATGGVFIFFPAHFSWLTLLLGLCYSACSAGGFYRAWLVLEMFSPFDLFDQVFSLALVLSLFSLVMLMGNLGYILVKKDHLDRRLYHLATRDPLTGVFNRSAFRHEARRFWSLARREGGPLSLLMTDLDHFKEVNDCYGHPAGDVVLQKVVKIMQDCLRPYDILGRYGGEEFLVLLPGAAEKEAKSVAERIREKVEQSFLEHDPPYGCTVSVGLASCRPSRDSLELRDLIHFSDVALYAAKDRGRNCVVVFSDVVPDLPECKKASASPPKG